MGRFLQIVIKIILYEARTADHAAYHFLEVALVLTRERLFKRLEHLIKEFIALAGFFRGVVLACLRYCLLDFLFEHCFVLGYHENVSDSFLHGDGD